MKTSAACLALVFAVLPLAAAAADPPAGTEPTLTVTGSASVTRAPDTATFGAEIVTNAPSATAAQSQNNARFAAVQAALAKQGIDKSNIEGQSYSMNYNPPPQPPGGGPRHLLTPVAPGSGERYGYIVSRNVRVTVTRVDRVGAAIDAAVAAGLTGVNGVDFGLSDKRSAFNDAMAGALADADAQAKALAATGRFRLGSLRQVQSGYSPGPIASRMFAAAPMAAGVPTNIEPSNVSVQATLTVTYAILPNP
ncbi:MAG: SIMPL domain-containing protein [Candidatus Baltobacteraceae bacterium]